VVELVVGDLRVILHNLVELVVDQGVDHLDTDLLVVELVQVMQVVSLFQKVVEVVLLLLVGLLMVQVVVVEWVV
tara:strand:- start:291 stop:512 length:222 start_codon:yes stop_codon:yes gene_type:complete